MIFNLHGNAGTAVQAVGCTRNSWVVGADRHLYLVEDTLVHVAACDQGLCRLMDAHVYRTDVVGGSHNEIRPGDQSILIG